jgi:hypothetical protein
MRDRSPAASKNRILRHDREMDEGWLHDPVMIHIDSAHELHPLIAAIFIPLIVAHRTLARHPR